MDLQQGHPGQFFYTFGTGEMLSYRINSFCDGGIFVSFPQPLLSSSLSDDLLTIVPG
jgi:hypothetical protein